MSRLNTIDLCCGCGGFTQGLKDAGFNIVAGIDIWQSAISTYEANHATSDHLAICKDISTYGPDDLCMDHGIKKGDIDVIVAGVPCQGFSNAGKRDVNDPRNSLFMNFIEYLSYYEPKMFIMENVIGILSMKNNKGEKCIDIIIDLLSVDYNVIISKLYASDFEVPQNRRRVLIFGIHKKYNTHPTEPNKVIMNESDRIPVSTVLTDRDDIPSSYYLSERAISGILRKKEKSKNEGKGFGAQFLTLSKPSYTIPARYWKDGYDALVKYSDTEIRRLTICELIAIQTFPDDYVFKGTKKDVIIQIGNAVACKFAYHVGIHIKNIIEKLSVRDNVSDVVNSDTDLTKKTVVELKKICKERHLSGYSKLKKCDLISLLS
jgi:DNA (cytosine-5)-methyltransferase 1